MGSEMCIRDRPLRRSQSTAELAGALYLFRSLHPDIDVRYDGSETTAYQASQSSSDNPFGDIFGETDDPSLIANDPFGGRSVASDDPFSDNPFE